MLRHARVVPRARKLHALPPIRIGLAVLDRLRRRRFLRPQSLEIVEFAHLGSEHVHDHVAGIDQHPVAIGQALDVDAFDAGFLQALVTFSAIAPTCRLARPEVTIM